jgi:hypothetical protein
VRDNPLSRDLVDVYDRSLIDNLIVEGEPVDQDVILARLRIAKEVLASAKDAIDEKRFTAATLLYHDAIAFFGRALLACDGLSAKDEESLFACVCMRYEDLELDWQVFERLRTTVHNVNSGKETTLQAWKEFELPCFLYVKVLHGAVEKRIVMHTTKV